MTIYSDGILREHTSHSGHSGEWLDTIGQLVQ
jgi:hypothetical protein